MFFTILKKDLLRKKSMNIILFIFIVLCTIFLASSVTNLMTTTSAIQYFGEITKASDYTFVTSHDDEVAKWVEGNEEVKDFSRQELLLLQSSDIKVKGKELDARGSLFFSEVPKDYNLVLEEKDEPLTHLNPGEIAISNTDAQRNNLQLGDVVNISYGGIEKPLTLAYITKDMVFGSNYMGFFRMVTSDKDYADLHEANGAVVAEFYSIITDDPLVFERGLGKKAFTTYASFDKTMLENVYTMEMMMAAILMVMSIILIIIAFVILRFTIAFTIQEDYREIGVMKAIGLKSRSIKQIYSTKYFGLSVIGAVLGLLISFPFSNLMVESLQENIAMAPASANMAISLLCGLLIVALVMLFCYLSMGKVNKMSAVAAMRDGATGENYKTRKLYAIHKHLRLPLSFQMALNDILCNTKSYVALVITFTLGALMIILPANASNTLKAPGIIEYFGIAQSDVYVTTHNEEKIAEEADRNALSKFVADIEETYAREGVDVDFHAEYMLNTSIYVSDPDEAMNVPAFQAYEFPADGYAMFTEETAPLLSNELALTQLVMDRLGVNVGDTVQVIMGGKTQEFIVTGSYESMNFMGSCARLSEKADIDFSNVTGIWALQGDFVDRDDIEGQIGRMKEITPDYEIQNVVDFTANTLDEIVNMLEMIKNMVLVVVLFINVLITILLARTFLTRDASEIALLKSTGFRNSTIRASQSLRIIIVLFVSIMLGILLSNLLNPLMVQFTFGLMGAANVSQVIIWQEVYVLYPAILFAATSLAAIVCMGNFDKYSLKDIGNME